MDPEKKRLNFIFPTKYGIPKSSKPVSHWLSKNMYLRIPTWQSFWISNLKNFRSVLVDGFNPGPTYSMGRVSIYLNVQVSFRGLNVIR